jgi:hypothetical protein
VRFPPVNAPAEYKVPDVPLVTVHKNAPAAVIDALITNDVAEVDIELVAVAVKVAVFLVPAYAVVSAHPEDVPFP